MSAKLKAANAFSAIAKDALSRIRAGDAQIATYTQVLANSLIGMVKVGEFSAETVKGYNGKSADDLKAFVSGSKLALLGDKPTASKDRTDAAETGKQARINDERRIERAAQLAFILGKLGGSVAWDQSKRCIVVKEPMLFLSVKDRKTWEPIRNRACLMDGKSFLVQDGGDKLRRINRSISVFVAANAHRLPKNKSKKVTKAGEGVTIEAAIKMVGDFAKQPQSKESRMKLQPLAALLFAAFDKNEKAFIAAAKSAGDDGATPAEAKSA